MRRLLVVAGIGVMAVAGCSADADTGELEKACEKSYEIEQEPRPERGEFVDDCVQKLQEMNI